MRPKKQKKIKPKSFLKMATDGALGIYDVTMKNVPKG